MPGFWQSFKHTFRGGSENKQQLIKTKKSTTILVQKWTYVGNTKVKWALLKKLRFQKNILVPINCYWSVCFLVSGVQVPFYIVGWRGSSPWRLTSTLLESICDYVHGSVWWRMIIPSILRVLLQKADVALVENKGVFPLREWLKKIDYHPEA